MSENIKHIDKENTALGELGLTYDLIMDGEFAELSPEPKINRKIKYVRHEDITKIIEAYSTDLREAYKVNESLEEYLMEMKGDLDNAIKAFESTKAQLTQILQSEQSLKTTETLLGTLEEQLDKLEKAKMLDAQTIAELRQQVAELEENQSTVEDLSQEVDNILSNLRSYFDEEGIQIDDE